MAKKVVKKRIIVEMRFILIVVANIVEIEVSRDCVKFNIIVICLIFKNRKSKIQLICTTFRMVSDVQSTFIIKTNLLRFLPNLSKFG